MLNEILLELTKWIQAPSYIDVKTFVHWHQTCRYSWNMYQSLPLLNLQAIIGSKYNYIETNYAESKYYEIYYNSAMLDTFNRLLCIFGILDHCLTDVQKKMHLSNYCNPLAKICKLCDLKVLDTKIFIVSNGNVYGHNLLKHAMTWVKLRYGWDVRLATVDTLNNFALLPLDNVPQSHKDYVLVACQAKYHKVA